MLGVKSSCVQAGRLLRGLLGASNRGEELALDCEVRKFYCDYGLALHWEQTGLA